MSARCGLSSAASGEICPVGCGNVPHPVQSIASHIIDDDNVRAAVGPRQELIVEFLPGSCFVGRCAIQRSDEGR
jgi:hypothetical protein